MPSNITRPRLVLTAILFLLVLVNSLLIGDIKWRLYRQEKIASEKSRPANVELTIISAPDCKACSDISLLLEQLKKKNIKITSEKTAPVASDEAVELLKKYTIVKVPTIILRGELEKNADLKEFLSAAGQIQSDGVFIATNLLPPYLDPVSGQVKGVFTVTYLTDKTCKECYDPTLHRQALQNFGMQASEEKTIDRADKAGAQLIAKYKITSVPTLVLQGDLKEYSALGQIWSQVGTIEKDGTYIFRAGQDIMGVYKDLKTGQLKNVKK